MAAALAVGVLGIAGAYLFYGRGPSKTVDDARRRPARAASTRRRKHKLWVDEIYDAIIVRPFSVVARGLFEIVDRFIIDTVAVNGAAFVVGLFGRMSRWFQNGQVQRYLVGRRRRRRAGVLHHRLPPQADVRLQDRRRPAPSSTPSRAPASSARRAKLHWDLDGDGEPDQATRTSRRQAARQARRAR